MLHKTTHQDVCPTQSHDLLHRQRAPRTNVNLCGQQAAAQTLYRSSSSSAAPVQHAMHTVWETLEFMANTFVFVYAGTLIAARIWEGHHGSITVFGEASTAAEEDAPAEQTLFGKDWAYALLNWVLLNVIRFVTLALMKPVLNTVNDGFSWTDVALATWAGLRGAVGLSLALVVDLQALQGEAGASQRCAVAAWRRLPPSRRPLFGIQFGVAHLCVARYGARSHGVRLPQLGQACTEQTGHGRVCAARARQQAGRTWLQVRDNHCLLRGHDVRADPPGAGHDDAAAAQAARRHEEDSDPDPAPAARRQGD